ncbi:MAG: hypothetical protein HOV81_13905 [Kofleriaceae bacterium]|nr:hypothetical protein [Kofleriaceae bacterium]
MFEASSADVRRLRTFESCAFEAAATFNAVELSPVVPLGATACGGVDPNNVLAAVRFAEAAADPAVGLTVHAALDRLRHRAATTDTRRWCTSQRVLRLQPTNVPGFTPHFRLFALLTATRSAARAVDASCEHAALVEQLAVWAQAIDTLADHGFRFSGLRVVLSETSLVHAALRAQNADGGQLSRQARAHVPGSTEAALARANVSVPREAEDLVGAVDALQLDGQARRRARTLVDEVGLPLQRAWPGLQVVYDLGRLQGLEYYEGPFIQLVARRDDGFEMPIGDGGALPWLGEMLSDRRERLVVTGVGAEACVKMFDAVSPSPARTQ